MELGEKYKNIRAFIVLLAALITWLLNMKYKRNLLESLIILLIVIVAFYISATIAIKLIDKIRGMDQVKDVDLEKEQSTEDSDVEDDVQ